MDRNQGKPRNTTDNRSDNENNDKDLPGYPHYSKEEDIMNPGNGNRKVKADVEDLANSKNLSARIVGQSDRTVGQEENNTEEEDDLGIVQGTEADVTEDDLQLLGDKDADQDLNDDELLRTSARVDEIDEEEDLDVPGSDLDDNNESLGEEDEENNYYSLGGDRHENLEDDPAGGNQDQ